MASKRRGLFTLRKPHIYYQRGWWWVTTEYTGPGFSIRNWGACEFATRLNREARNRDLSKM